MIFIVSVLMTVLLCTCRECNSWPKLWRALWYSLARTESSVWAHICRNISMALSTRSESKWYTGSSLVEFRKSMAALDCTTSLTALQKPRPSLVWEKHRLIFFFLLSKGIRCRCVLHIITWIKWTLFVIVNNIHPLDRISADFNYILTAHISSPVPLLDFPAVFLWRSESPWWRWEWPVLSCTGACANPRTALTLETKSQGGSPRTVEPGGEGKWGQPSATASHCPPRVFLGPLASCPAAEAEWVTSHLHEIKENYGVLFSVSCNRKYILVSRYIAFSKPRSK